LFITIFGSKAEIYQFLFEFLSQKQYQNIQKLFWWFLNIFWPKIQKCSKTFAENYILETKYKIKLEIGSLKIHIQYYCYSYRYDETRKLNISFRRKIDNND